MKTFQSIKSIEQDDMVVQTVDLPEVESTIADEVEKFESNYSDTKIKELTTLFDSIAIDEEILNSVTTTRENAIEKERVSFRQKLFLTFSIAVTALLLYLAIFNIISINAISSSIDLIEGNIATETTLYNALQQDVDSMNDTSDIMAELGSEGYFKMNDNDVIYVEITKTTPPNDVAGATNWFDSICNFVSSVFGG